MNGYKIIAASVAMLSIVLLLAVVGTGLVRSNDSPKIDLATSIPSLSGFQIIQIGSNGLMSEVVSGLASRGAQVEQFSDIPPSREFTHRAAVVMDGEWLASRVDRPELHTFLGQAVAGGAPLVVIGSNTSELYVALDRAEVSKLPVTETGIVRNPAYFNPPQVGLKLKVRNGHTYSSHLASNSNDPADLIEALTNWLPEDLDVH